MLNMEYKELRTYIQRWREFETTYHRTYNYSKNGILKHNLPTIITNSNNPVVQSVLTFLERTFQHVYRYIEYLRNFKTFYNY